MNLGSIKISIGSLKKLFFRSCDMLDEFKLDTPNLRIFKYYGNLVPFSSNALALSETTLSFSSDNSDNQWYGKLIELLSTFNHCPTVLNIEYDPEVCFLSFQIFLSKIFYLALKVLTHFSCEKKKNSS